MHELAAHERFPPEGRRFKHVVFRDSFHRARHQADLGIEVGRRLASNAAPERPDDDSFVGAILEGGGLDLIDYRVETLRRRLPACLRALRVDSPSEAQSLLQRHPDLSAVALGALIIGVTSFFRDPPVFHALQTHVLSALVDVESRPRARIWSAGCSDGAELYSVAILLAELGLLHRCDLLGTDCRPTAIDAARLGEFDAFNLRGIPAPLRVRYFRGDAARLSVVDAVRRAASWRVGNFMIMPEPGLWDLILCRNVAIYLRDDAIPKLWRSLASRLRLGGVLVVGKAERLPPVSGLSMIAPCIYRRDTA